MIAISYRRDDSLPVAGRLYDRLEQRFGKNNVFMDFDSIRPGFDFRDQIKETIERSKVVIAVIGPHWLGEQNDGSRRIDDPTDFVRLEVAHALERGIPVIPVLVNNAPIPKPETLPLDIQALAYRHGLPLDSGVDFRQHADRLINSISTITDSRERRSSKDQTVIEDRPKVQAAKSKVLRFVAVGVATTAIFLLGLYVWWYELPARRPQKPAEPGKVTKQDSGVGKVTTTFDRANAAYVASDYHEAERLALAAAEEAEKGVPPKPSDAMKAYNLAALSAGWRGAYWVPGGHFEIARDHTRNSPWSFKLSASEPNHIRWVRPLRLEPHVKYLLTVWIRTQDVAHSKEPYDRGANAAIQFMSPTQNPIHSEPVFGTSDWRQVSLQFATSDMVEIEEQLQLGGYSATTTGTAWFDDVQLKKLP